MSGEGRRIGGPQEHLLKQLVFPSRFEVLEKYIGAEIARLVVEPPAETRDALEAASQAAKARSEGIFLPFYADSGTGKTTLANSLTTFFPADFTPTENLEGTVTFEDLKSAARSAVSSLPANDGRIIPVNIDHRESDPPSPTELSHIKRFLRESTVGHRTALLWPETSEDIARKMAADFKKIAGTPAIPIPIQIDGPPRETWVAIAQSTLQLANSVDSLELLGVNPKDYSPGEFPSIGEFLRKISDDFSNRRLEMLRETRKPIRLAVIFVSESPDAGVLMQLTNSSKFGLMDGNALLDATRESVVGRWWSERRGLLTQMIVQLDARLFGMPPQTTIPILRRFGSESIVQDLIDLDVGSARPSDIKTSFRRSDFGKYLNGTARPTYETRGTPAAISSPAFALLADKGFTGGQDKAFNRSMLEAVRIYLDGEGISVVDSAAEQRLSFCPLIPDNYFEVDGDVICVEYTWRKGLFLTNTNRGNIAQYVLSKLQNYARELGRA
ncbi:hypothetical protein [Micromonospora sp. NBC_01813]|uniref:hypothetical protein n=1 Tax=Micromonospora sp. NBC_01813 TaxID=2975988 RepID=UPI002DDA2E0D|nr:hypothetical protein [Micromonospora sp. NBC_01813]WSA09001.1 hypothetical protein OG958_33415 [Micromonospora sp. NBC_01813]